MYKKLLIIISLLCTPVLCVAGPSINQLNSCLALVDFVDIKLDEFAENHSPSDVQLVHKGLSSYSKFLQHEVIKPKIVGMYGGNQTQAKLMLRVFSKQRDTYVKQLSKRYTKQKFLTDYVASIASCRSRIAIESDTTKGLDTAVKIMNQMSRS